MAFMVPQYTDAPFYKVTTDSGDSWLVPAEFFGSDPDPSDFSDYVEFGEPEEIELVEGYFARLSAPGYLDSTEWAGPFETLDAAKEYIADTWDVDPETGEEVDDRRVVHRGRGKSYENPEALARKLSNPGPNTKKLKSKLLK